MNYFINISFKKCNFKNNPKILFIIYLLPKHKNPFYLLNRIIARLGNCSLLLALSLFSKRAPKSDLFFRSFQKEQNRAIRSFALYQKSDKERFALIKRVQKSKSLFCSFKKSTKTAKERITLYKKSKRAQKEQIALLLF